jgi:precorrin-6B C5,15-methyltransferase / cobalt-precorrin-6B C5,C15-methyltransferase
VPEGRRIVVVGFADPLPVAAAKALADAELVVGSPRFLEAVGATGRTLALGRGGATLAEALDALAGVAGRAVVLASGDPGFFGVVRALADRFGPHALEVHPAPSSVSLAFARLGLPWDDALVVSTLGRSLPEAAALAAASSKAAVLCCADAPPEAVGRALLDALGDTPNPGAGSRFDRVAVGSALGTPAETVEEMTLAALAAGRFPPASLVVLVRGRGVAEAPVLAWGRPARAYLSRGGMITKSEVRAVVLARLELPAGGVLWDVGAGSGSVGIESAGLVPGLRVLAVERDPAACGRIRANAGAAGVAVEVVEGEAPGVLAPLPDPDRIFVGGGGIAVLDAALARLAPGGRLVATYASIDRAAQAWSRLGEMVQLSVSRAAPLAGGVRLVAADPVFVCWGPAGAAP